MGNSAAQPGQTPAETVPVVLPVALGQSYDYLLPDGVAVAAGDFVLVPFGPQNRIGIVWDKPVGAQKPVDPKKLKTIAHRLDAPSLPAIQMRFAEWVARYTLAPIGMVARMLMSADSAFEEPKPRFGVRRVEGAVAPAKMTPARTRVLECATDGLIRSKSELAALAGCSTAVIDGLVAAGSLIDVAIPERGFANPNPTHHATEFTDAQSQAVMALRSAVDADAYNVTLLDGVTGSGKTEVYFEAVAAALAREAQVLIMLPEIALTSQFLDRFERRFGVKPVEWHSALQPAERGRIWKGVARGDVRCVVGARSALFLPYPALGLIIVDEEHDQGYKQDDRVHYQARDMSVVRASLGGFPVVLASATPSIETRVNAQNARYRHVILPGRFTGVEMPDVAAIDLRKEPPEPGKWLSPRLVAAMRETFAAKRQSLLFLNRRGYAPLTLCRSCGHRLECPQCTAWLVEHRFKKRLDCHHCGFSLSLPEKCMKCAATGSLVACGPGIERVAEEVAERFPDARIALLSSDLIPGLAEMRAMIHRIEAGEVDIVVGTQLVAKGHNFPDLSLVGVVDGDLGLAHGADPRAAERTFQLLQQVTGRAGRMETVGRGFVQTYQPEHPVMAAIVAGDAEQFLNYEIRTRQQGVLPPFGRLAAIIVSAKDKTLAEKSARDIARHAPPSDKITVLGPAEAPIAVVRGRYRWRLLAKAPRDIDLQGYLRAWEEGLPKMHSDVRVTLDIDPYNFF